MARIRREEGLTFEDVLLVPQHSHIKSRKDVDLSTDLAGIKLNIPIISANMDSITELDMAKAMSDQGGLGILHRFADPAKINEWIKSLRQNNGLAIPSIGVSEEDKDKALTYKDSGATAICVDIAHGDSILMVEMIKFLKKNDITVIAGNIATKDGAYTLAATAGADIIKVGIGPGSLCTTRVQTGCGMPQLTAIMEVRKQLFDSFPIIADGGIKNSGDIVKALAAGANAVMIGGLFAGCTETPNINGVKMYRGMASREAQIDFRGIVNNDTPEGVSMNIEQKGPVSEVLKELIGGVRSGLSYNGATNIKELQEYAEFIKISTSGWAEGLPHGLK